MELHVESSTQCILKEFHALYNGGMAKGCAKYPYSFY